MLAFGKETGYEIKQFVDKSTRHFWAASYGQIYPELRRLEAAGLVESRSEPLGGRARTAYRLTVAGRQTFADWLQSSHEPLYELRDEGMLKLFFSDLGAPDLATEHLQAMRARHQRKLEQLRSIQPVAETGPPGPRLTLELGIGLTEWMVNWCETTARRLADSNPETTARRLADSNPETTARRLADSNPETTARRLADSNPETTARRLADSNPETTARRHASEKE
jgi:DNA-binding PadR family transcriptional regulator